MTRIWEPGDQAIVRMIEPDGKLHSVRPVTVVADDGAIAAVQLVAGTTIAQPVFAERSELIKLFASGRWTVAERTWTDNDVLILLREGDPYSPQLYVARDGSLKLWYVNLQDPVRRTSVGFDTSITSSMCSRRSICPGGNSRTSTSSPKPSRLGR